MNQAGESSYAVNEYDTATCLGAMGQCSDHVTDAKLLVKDHDTEAEHVKPKRASTHCSRLKWVLTVKAMLSYSVPLVNIKVKKHHEK